MPPGAEPAAGRTERGLLQAFFQESYLQEHPEDEGNIEKLKDLIAWQVQPAASLRQRRGELPWGTKSQRPCPMGAPPTQADLALFSRRPRCWQRGSGSTGGR